MSSQLIRSGECRKFSPNIFNKTKCTNCFRQKEEHTAEALESNRATRKVAKCGYLFVAPGWDFTNPVNRTKRWQRRWFVLYDDGELSYSLDEHPETVPQASIDMNKAVEVTDAEEVTGNAFSLAITAPDHVHFVKGTSREEIRFWSDVLSVFPRSKGRHKRNATFPGTQTKSSHSLLQTPIRGGSNNKMEARNQYNARLSGSPLWDGDDVFPTRDTPSTPTSPADPNTPDSRKVYLGSPPTRDKIDDKNRRRISGRDKRCVKNSGRSISEDISKMVPNSWNENQVGLPDVSRRLLLNEFDNDCKLKDIDSITQSRSPSSQPIAIEPTRDNDHTPHKQIRGDPDGCGLDVSTLRYSPSDLRVDLQTDELLNVKKGWLLKQGQEKGWSKHWFVLRGNALLYYRDPSAEDQGILDGVVDLSGVTSVSEVQAQRNYGFLVTTWDERQFVLSAITAGIRSHWMSAIRKAASLPDPNPTDLPSPIQEGTDGSSVVSSTGMTSRSLLFSSDDEYRTASDTGGGGGGSVTMCSGGSGSGGRRESGEWGEALPPSPPLNRTPMSRVKERARGVSKLKVHTSKRSRSSPPSSRRSTLDSISSQDLMSATVSPPMIPENKGTELDEVKQELSVRLRELSSAQEEIMRQRQRQSDIATLEKQVEELTKRAEESGKQRARDAAELDALKKRFVDEKAAWERAGRAVEAELEETSGRCAGLCAELAASREASTVLRNRLSELDVRLDVAAAENDALFTRISQLTNKSSSSSQLPARSRSLDSLSDLTNIDLDLEEVQHIDKERLVEEYVDMRNRFDKAVTEIRAMKRELREAHAQVDWLELSLVSSRQEANVRKEEVEASNNLMAARIQDLACKLSAAEKQIRTLKQKLSKTETRDKRRSLSLKGRDSFTLSKEFEDKLAELEKKVISIEVKQEPKDVKDKKADRLAARLRRKSLDSATSSEPMKVLLRLNTLEAKIAKVGNDSSGSDGKQSNELKLFNGNAEGIECPQAEIVNEVKKMENLLRAKLVVLSKKRESLITAGNWNNEAQLNLLAEKLAYESVLIGRLHDAIVENRGVDTTDAQRLLESLDNKLSGGSKTNMETSLDYLVKSLVKHLSQQTVRRVNRKVKEKKKTDQVVADLLERKYNVDAKVINYINDTVDELAELLVQASLIGDNYGKEYSETAWVMAKEAVNQELIQEEIMQVMSQCTQQYTQHIKDENLTRFACVVKDRANLELWASTAGENLKVNMEAALSQLSEQYQLKLDKCKLALLPTCESRSIIAERIKQVLHSFADIVAHKSLLDARIAVVCRDEASDSEQETSSTIEENSLLSEIQYLYVKFCQDLSQDSKDGEKLKELVNRIGTDILCLEEILVPSENKLGVKVDKVESSGDTWIDSISKKFEVIKERILNIQKYAKDCRECEKCTQMHQEVIRIEQEYNTKILEIQRKQEKEMVHLKTEYEKQKEQMIERHKEEAAVLFSSNKELEKELETLSNEYSEQIDSLKASYEQLAKSAENELDEDDSLHRRYQKEIQHLKNVCEKGLIGMENAHRRQIEELEEKHEREIQCLRIEKEQALAEETHATLAALDAMRKAHEAEVQKEIAKFKTEFLNRMQSNCDFSALHRQHQAEMSEIKHEILSLSEKYSVKCVENASLEDKLRSANQQLAHAHQHILQLDNRYKQLRDQITAEANSEPPLPRLHDHPHGVVASNSPRVVHCIPKYNKAPSRCQANSKSRLRKNLSEPTPLLKAEVTRSPEMFSLCGMVSKRREEYERRLNAPATCTQSSRVTFI